ncbi:putative cell wall glucanase [Talaromyces proteolyticus]|uniref:Cell wall glucanase n=1 Tax=Talaromyces proteolyticus TaxID=1131652 RepID=A0AAD4Q3L2_9EURO|nr:putative cell wall glucanase [Talaromyces proteolyticus]KAH8701857.1 putative cell wall glucanase [Talaromyces proteolyticus]
MKYSALGLGVLALLHSANGHLHRTFHRQANVTRVGIDDEIDHGKQFPKRDAETRSCPEGKTTNTVVVHVDQEGNTLSMETVSATSSSLVGYSSSIPPAQNIDYQWKTGFSSPTKKNKHGISYSPYNADSTCKGQDQVNDDINSLRQFSLVRIYGVDCDQVKTVTRAARQNQMQVFAGVFNVDSLQNDLQKIIDAADGDWSTFHTVSIGNELVNRAQNSPEQIVQLVNTARDTLRQAGYHGPVVTVDTFNQIIEHPELCEASDYCAANCHAFFDSTQTADTAGPYVLEQARLVSEAVGGSKKVIITESGWPSAGVPNGNAIPSRPNQEVALKSLRENFPHGGLILFSAFDDKWKADNEGTFGTEKFWGIELGEIDRSG